MANSGIYEEDYGSDHDSLYADHDSPSDGYFTHRPFPTSQFVENSSVTAEADAKAREAAESRASSSENPPSAERASPNFATRSPVWAQPDEQTPLLDAGPAPPDYAAATAHRTAGSTSTTSSATEQSARPQSYGSIPDSPEARSEHSATSENELPWPLGSRGNPFHNNPNFPFGPNGNPVNSPNFPFGPSGNPVNQPGFPFRSTSDQPGAHNMMFPSGQPQSMSNAPPRYTDEDDANEELGVVGQYRNRRDRRGWRRLTRYCKFSTMLSWLLIFGLVFVVLYFGLGDAHHSQDVGDISPGEGTGDKPAKDDPNAPLPMDPPQKEEPPQSSLPPHRATSACELYHYTGETTWHFNGNGNFSFYELVEASTFMKLNVGGTIYIQAAPEEQEHDIIVSVTYATSRLWRVTLPLHYDNDESSLSLQFPNVEKLGNNVTDDGYACMDVVAVVRIKEGVTIDNFDLATANLNVVAEEGLFDRAPWKSIQPLYIANVTTINSVRGSVDLSYWSSRQTYIETTSGPIFGEYALRDLLSVKSSAGPIGIVVDPKEADKDHPMPADFSAIATSGTISVKFSLTGSIPDREYRSRVETYAGTISGEYLLGLMSTFRTTSGTINARILPYDWNSYASSLHTESSSGTSNIEVLPSHIGPDRPIGRLHSFHKSSAGSGSVRVKYPGQWEGYIDAESKSGSVNVQGDEVVVDVDSHLGPAGSVIIAHKGEQSSRMEVRSGSGSVNVKVG